MLLNATLWFTVTHTIKINGPKLADWSKWICLTLWSCFCSLLTSNWKFSTSRLHYSFVNFIQITHFYVISSYIDDIETNLPILKHTSRTLHEILKRMLAKVCFDASFMCLSRFDAVSVTFTIYAVERNVVAFCHAYIKGYGPKLADWSKWIRIRL